MELPEELPELPEVEPEPDEAPKWSTTHFQKALGTAAFCLGLAHLLVYWVLLLAFIWVGLEFNKHIVLRISLRQPLRYWVFMLLWTPALFLLVPYGAGRVIALIVRLFSS